MYVPLRVAAKHYNVSKQTIAIWSAKGDIQTILLPSGQRRFKITGDGNVERPTQRTKVCYCRVSSQGQKDDLERQISYMREKYPGWEIHSDIGSGLNWKRTKLRAILRRCLQGDIECIAVAHKDRLARFGFEIIEFMLAEVGVKLLCDDEEVHTSKEEELAEDILSIITVFSSRLYGRRKYKKDPQDHSEAECTNGAQINAMDGLLQVDV